MPLSDMKKSGWSQGLYEISSTAKEQLGTLRIDNFGRKFRYCQAGSSALSAGKLGLATVPAAGFLNIALTTAAAIGTKEITQTIAASGDNACDEDAFRGGFFMVNDGTGQGYSYPIDNSTEVKAASTSITITLAEGIQVALTTSSEISIIPPPGGFSGVTESATEEAVPAGIPLVAVTGDYYYWAQTGGVANVLVGANGDSAVVGSMVCADQTAGSVRAINSTLDIDVPWVGVVYSRVWVQTEYCPIFLTID